EKQQFEEVQQIVEQRLELENQLAEQMEEVDDRLKNPLNNDEKLAEMKQTIIVRNEVIEEETPIIKKETNQKSVPSKTDTVEKADGSSTFNGSMEQITNTIDQITAEITELDGFQTLVDDLKDKRNRLTNRELTIALFGAFSAGKSSFSNALFGEKIL